MAHFPTGHGGSDFGSIVGAMARLESLIDKFAKTGQESVKSAEETNKKNQEKADKINKENQASADKINKQRESLASKINKDIEKENEKARKFNQVVDQSIAIKTRLSGATTLGANQKIIQEIIGKGLGGAAQPDIEKSFVKFNEMRKLADKQAKDSIRLERLAHKHDLLEIQHLGTPLGARHAALSTQFRGQSQQAVGRHYALQRGSQAALRRARKSALGSTGIQTQKRGIGGRATPTLVTPKIVNPKSKIIPAGAALANTFTALSKVGGLVVGVMSLLAKSVKHAEETIQRYGLFSSGGVAALIVNQQGEMYRNIKTSHELSESMLEFAKSNNKMKDSWRSTFSFIDKLNLKLATITDAILEFAGKISGKAVEKIDEVMGDISKWGPAARSVLFETFPLLELISKNWQTAAQQEQEAKNRETRRLNWLMGIPQMNLRPEDITAGERQMFENAAPQIFGPMSRGFNTDFRNMQRTTPMSPGGPGALDTSGMLPVPPQQPISDDAFRRRQRFDQDMRRRQQEEIQQRIGFNFGGPINGFYNKQITQPGKGWGQNDTLQV